MTAHKNYTMLVTTTSVAPVRLFFFFLDGWILPGSMIGEQENMPILMPSLHCIQSAVIISASTE